MDPVDLAVFSRLGLRLEMRTIGATVRVFLFDEVELSGETSSGDPVSWSLAASSQPQILTMTVSRLTLDWELVTSISTAARAKLLSLTSSSYTALRLSV